MPLFSMPVPSAYGQNVKPYDGAKLYFYEAGTLIPKITYYDAEETLPQTHPVEANGSGQFPSIFISGVYKVVLTDKIGTLEWEEDGLPGVSVIQFKGTFDSLTNVSNYPADGNLGDLYKVIETFGLAAPSGSHKVVIGDYIVANKNGAMGIDADWDILRGLQSRSKEVYAGFGVDFTITGDSNWVTDYAIAIPFQTTSNQWAVEWFIMGTTSSTSTVNLSISGIEFLRLGVPPGSPDFNQSLSGGVDSGGTPRSSTVTAYGRTPSLDLRTSGGPGTRHYFNGTTLVTVKPSWAI